MKASITLTLLILAAALTIGWRVEQRLENARSQHAALVAAAARAGISLDTSHPGRVRPPRPEHEDRQAEAENLIKDFIAFYRENDGKDKYPSSLDEAGQRKNLELMARLLSLDAAQLEIFIAGLRDSGDLKPGARIQLAWTAIRALAEDRPQAAIRIFQNSPDLLPHHEMVHEFLSMALNRWGRENPMAAIDWFRQQGKPPVSKDYAMASILSGVATTDPRLAFRLMGELGGGYDAVGGIVRAAVTAEERTATLTALREHLATLTDGPLRTSSMAVGYHALVRMAIQDGFEAGSKWISEAGFTPEEYAASVGGIMSHHVELDETGRWVDWMGANVPAGKADASVRNLVDAWTHRDHQAAGQWLAAMDPGSPARTPAVRAYAERISSYDPESAAQWALTLPPGKEQKAALKRISRNWPQNDEASKAAAEAFRLQHGIK